MWLYRGEGDGRGDGCEGGGKNSEVYRHTGRHSRTKQRKIVPQKQTQWQLLQREPSTRWRKSSLTKRFQTFFSLYNIKASAIYSGHNGSISGRSAPRGEPFGGGRGRPIGRVSQHSSSPKDVWEWKGISQSCGTPLVTALLCRKDGVIILKWLFLFARPAPITSIDTYTHKGYSRSERSRLCVIRLFSAVFMANRCTGCAHYMDGNITLLFLF